MRNGLSAPNGGEAIFRDPDINGLPCSTYIPHTSGPRIGRWCAKPVLASNGGSRLNCFQGGNNLAGVDRLPQQGGSHPNNENNEINV